MANLSEARAKYMKALSDRQDEIVRYCGELIKRPSENPPGDTTAAIGYVGNLLSDHKVQYEVVEPKPGIKSIVATHRFDKPGKKMLLAGHVDTFHVEDARRWDFDPFCGTLRDGKILGRGASDMKGGLAGSIGAFLAAHDLGLPLAGELILMTVADEENGGRLGQGWILDNKPQYVPDAALIGEPNSLDIVSIANKGITVLKLTVRGEPMHASICMGENAVTRAAEAILLLRSIMDIEGDTPPAMKAVLEAQNRHIESHEDQYYKGRTKLTTHPSYNPAIVQGGVRHNVVPHECIVKMDIRIPLGMTHRQLKEIVERKLAEKGFPDVAVEYAEENFNFDPHFTDPNHPFAQTVRRNVTEVTGKEPIFQITYPGGDIRYIRFRGIPGIIFGPRPFDVGGFNEHVRVHDVVVTAKVHGLTLFDFLAPV